MQSNKILSEINRTFKLAAPVALGQLGHILMGVEDSIMVGRVGAAPLAAASLVTGIFFLVLVIGLGVASAVTPLIAIAGSSNKKSDCGIILREGLLVALVFSAILSVILIIVSKNMNLLGQQTDVTVFASSYLFILALSVFPMMIFQNYRNYLEGLSMVKPPMLIAITANIGNIFFNWVFIYGNLGMPALGLDGAGFATLFTRTGMALVIIYYVHSSNKNKSYLKLFWKNRIDRKVINKIIAIGLPSGFQYFFEVAAFAFSAVMIGWMGKVQLAAHQIAMNLASVTYMIILGISSAGTIRVATGVGKNNRKDIRHAGFSTLLLAIGFMSVTAFLFFALRKYLPELYISNSEVILIASNLLILAALFQIFDGLQATGLGILRGLKDTKVPTIITFVAYWIIGIPLGYLLGFHFKMQAFGVWIGLSVSLALVATTLAFRFNIKSNQFGN